MTVLQTEGLTKVYTSQGKVATRALSNFSLEVKKGEFVGIMGPSGSGKTTLLNLLATIDRPTAGKVLIEGVDTAALKGSQLAAFRRRKLGFVFQDFNLLDTLTIGENIALPLVLERLAPREIQAAVQEVAGQLGIGDILDKYPYEVSGGQQQRAAAARAIIHRPAVLLADEPTGNLDSGPPASSWRPFPTSTARKARPSSWSPTIPLRPASAGGSSSSGTGSATASCTGARAASSSSSGSWTRSP